MWRHNSIYFGPTRHLNLIFSAKDQFKVNMLKLDTVQFCVSDTGVVSGIRILCDLTIIYDLVCPH